MPPPATQTIPAPDLRQVIASDGTRRFELSGAWTLRALRFRLTELAPRLAECAAAPSSQWDLRGVQAIEHAGAMLLWRAWGRGRAGGPGGETPPEGALR